MKQHPGIMLILVLCIGLFSCSGNPDKASETTDDAKPKTIPGLTAVDVHGNFTNKGFTLDKNIGAESSTWTCHSADGDKDYSVKIFGKSASDIDRIDAMVMFAEPDNNSRQFIGYAASVTYTGSNGPAATQWATDHFDTGGDTTIGSVRFVLIKGNETSRILKMNAQ
jgi:hypothetical protein